jgi:hypothetical protein
LTAPQAFFRPDRRFRTPARAEAVKVGRRSAREAHSDVSRPRLDSFEHGGMLDRIGAEGGCNLRRFGGLVCLTLPTKRVAGCFCVLAAALRSSSVGGAIEVRSTASEPARKKPGTTTKGKLDDAIRQLRVVAPRMPPEVAVTVPDSDA